METIGHNTAEQLFAVPLSLRDSSITVSRSERRA